MSSIKKRALVFLITAGFVTALAWSPLSDVFRNGRPADYYTHFPLVPLISALVLFRRWKYLFRGESKPILWGIGLIALGAGLVAAATIHRHDRIAHVELIVLGAILVLSGSFISLFGRKAFRRAFFPFMFLFFLVPLPLAWMDQIVAFLVAVSTGVTNLLFQAFRVPFVQEGPIFFLPGFDIEVATECSGIRSSLALLVTTVLAGQMFLYRPWKKLILILAVLPVTVLKNAVRIVTLYLLSYFVDMEIIEGGFLHRSGGFIFFGLGLAVLAIVLWVLRSPREAELKVMVAPFPPDNKGLTNG